jgi:sporulation protein YlmC with PRC-barrel domain
LLSETWREILEVAETRGRRCAMLEITEHTKVFTAHGEYVGRVDRIVIDPITRMVSHIVVHKGVLLPEDKVIPIDGIATATEERVHLARGNHPEEFLPFIEQHYVKLDDGDQDGNQDGDERGEAVKAPFVWYGPYGMASTMYDTQMRVVTERNIPVRAIALEPGASVCALGRVEIGELDEVITTEAGLATHIVVTMSDPSLDRKAIPMHWVDEIAENEIHLGATEWMIEAIELYDPHMSPLRG